MNQSLSEASRAILLIASLIVLQGCGQSPRITESPASWGRAPVGVPTVEQGKFWYAVCFRMPWDGNGRPSWAMDALLAREVVLPVLAENDEKISLWRFHRRAGRGAAGHQFTFLMYAEPEGAQAIQQSMQQSDLVQALLRAGNLKSVVRSCRGQEPQAALAAHSDPNWHPHIQRSWPYYIMGVSAHWLSLVNAQSEEIGLMGEQTIPELLRHYDMVHEGVTELWQGQGQHAYIHHLSAIFAYEPLYIQRLIQF